MIKEIIDIAFPAICLACGAKPKPLCENCVPEFSVQKDEAGTYFATELTDEVAEILKALKDLNRTALIQTLGAGFAPALQVAIAEFRPTLLACPPSSKRNFRKRGFNPALEICKAANSSGLTVNDKAVLHRFQPADQRSLDSLARHRNVAGLFQSRVSGARILLVDDAATTGATLQAMTLALEQKQNLVVGKCVLARRFLNSAHEQMK